MEDTQNVVADEVNRRMAQALDDIKAKYDRIDRERQITREAKAAAKCHDTSCASHSHQVESTNEEQGTLQDAETDDPELERIRNARLGRLRAQQQEKDENLRRGHGQYREITQDEFLPAVTGSKMVICHFYSDDFERCRIMDHHLAILAPRHIEALYTKINATRCPFFVEKLKIRVLPSVVLFVDGVAVERIVGFEGLSDKMPTGKEDEWTTNMLAQLLASKHMLTLFSDECPKEEKRELTLEDYLALGDDDLYDD